MQRTWSALQELKDTYGISPLTAAMILRRTGEKRVGELKQLCEDNGRGGRWEWVWRWLKQNYPPKTDWKKISACQQKESEDVADFTDRFVTLWLECSGLSDEDDVNSDASAVIKQIYLGGLKPDIAKALQLKEPEIGQDTTKQFEEIVKMARQIERNMYAKVRAIQTGWTPPILKGGAGPDTRLNPKSEITTRCHYCKNFGHWQKNCKKRLASEGRFGRYRDPPFNPSNREGQKNLLSQLQDLSEADKRAIRELLN